MTFRTKVSWFSVILVLVVIALVVLWQIGVIESIKWLNILCLVCFVIGLLLFVLMVACSRKEMHPEDIMSRAHDIEMKKRSRNK
jgi:Na+(H+)/acetate symporter ActP